MKRLTLTLMRVLTCWACVGLCGPVWAADNTEVTQLLTNAVVNATASVTSSAQRIVQVGTVEAVWIKAASASGAADVKLEYALSVDGSAWTDYGLYTDLVASTNTDFTTDPEGLHPILSPPLPASWVRYRVTGVNSNPTDTVVNLWFVGRGTNR